MWFDGKTGGVRKTKGAISAASTEKGIFARETTEVENALNEAEDTDKSSGDNEREEDVAAEVAGGLGKGQDVNNREDGEKNKPHDAGSKKATERVGRPKDRDGEIKRKKREEEEAAVGETGEVRLPEIVKPGSFRRDGLRIVVCRFRGWLVICGLLGRARWGLATAVCRFYG